MTNLLVTIQEDTTTAVDTLTSSYSDKWAGAETVADQASPIISAMASHDLIFVVLGVSLIIWFVLLFFIIRTDRKVSQLEETVKQKTTKNEL